MDIMISDTIPVETKTNEERGFPRDCFFRVKFTDGSERSETDTNWSDFSEVKEVEYFGKKKQVSVSKLPLKFIMIFHGDMWMQIEVPEDCEGYQAFSSEYSFMPTGEKHGNLNGRLVGVVKDGKVIEEKFLNARQKEVTGIRL